MKKLIKRYLAGIIDLLFMALFSFLMYNAGVVIFWATPLSFFISLLIMLFLSFLKEKRWVNLF
jgi:hypothetical protein